LLATFHLQQFLQSRFAGSRQTAPLVTGLFRIGLQVEVPQQPTGCGFADSKTARLQRGAQGAAADRLGRVAQ